MDDADVWKEYRRAQQQRRSGRLPTRQLEILAMKQKGFDVQELTPYHFRIDGTLDLFPVHKLYHFLPLNVRGDYHNALGLAITLLRGGK